MKEIKTEILDEVASYYSAKLAEHGATARGVDWNSCESQTLRFEQLCKIVAPGTQGFSVADLGCGYGALLEYMAPKYSLFSYLGVDVCQDMVRSATERHHGAPKARFLLGAASDVVSDYCVASGIFNVRLGRGDSEWIESLRATLDVLHETSRSGFAFNCLTSYSDENKKKDYLYYADPCALFDLCKRRYSRDVALLHDYGLYEFTVLVRKA